jgi:hypothetical protein
MSMGIHVDGYQDSGRLVHLPCRLPSPLVTGEQPLIRMGDRSGKQIARMSFAHDREFETIARKEKIETDHIWGYETPVKRWLGAVGWP